VQRYYCTAATWRFKNAAQNNAFQWFSMDCQLNNGAWHWYLWAMCKTLRKASAADAVLPALLVCLQVPSCCHDYWHACLVVAGSCDALPQLLYYWASITLCSFGTIVVLAHMQQWQCQQPALLQDAGSYVHSDVSHVLSVRPDLRVKGSKGQKHIHCLHPYAIPSFAPQVLTVCRALHASVQRPLQRTHSHHSRHSAAPPPTAAAG
jgi:hypothetical protein